MGNAMGSKRAMAQSSRHAAAVSSIGEPPTGILANGWASFVGRGRMAPMDMSTIGGDRRS